MVLLQKLDQNSGFNNIIDYKLVNKIYLITENFLLKDGSEIFIS